ncbi:MAG: metal-sulfur cluster assembly factor [Verrucomicrobiota bacterium]|nr:metal-sulfur cluster assembly factor [Verrucomicrobiota bacterium]
MSTDTILSSEQVILHLRGLIDPELCLNVVDLGMVESVRIDEGRVEIDLLLTSPGCPLQGVFTTGAQAIVGALPGVTSVVVNFPELPPWTTSRIAPEVLDQL